MRAAHWFQLGFKLVSCTKVRQLLACPGRGSLSWCGDGAARHGSMAPAVVGLDDWTVDLVKLCTTFASHKQWASGQDSRDIMSHSAHDFLAQNFEMAGLVYLVVMVWLRTSDQRSQGRRCRSC